MSTIDELYKQDCLRDAARDGRIDVVRKYLNDDTVNVNGRGGDTALHYACRNGHRDVVELLLDNGADIDARSHYNNSTPLMFACDNDHTPTIKLLLDRGCAVNSADDDGDTALHWACWNGYTECVKELLAHGANICIKNTDHQTPLDIAQKNNYQAVIDLLMEHTNKHSSSERNIMDSNQNEKNSILVSEEGVVSNLKAKVVEPVASSLDEPHSTPKVQIETIVNRCCKELHDQITSKQEEILNQTIQKLTSDFECKIEALRSEICAAKRVMSQHAISNVEVSKCVFNLCTIVENLSLKVSSSSQASNEGTCGTSIINERYQHVSKDDVEMIS